MLKTSVTRFNEDLNQLSSHIKNKQTSQIRQTIKNKSYASAGLVQKTEVKSPPPIIIQQQQQPSTQITQQAPIVIQEQVIFHQPSSIGSTIKIEHQLPTELVTTTSQPQTSSHITLNRLNAQEEEMDDETSFENEVKMEAGFSEVSWSNLNGLTTVNDFDNDNDDEDTKINNESEEFLSDDGDDDGGDFLS